MTIQLGDTLRSNRIDQVETTIAASGKLQIRTGAQPANCAAADSGTLLCEITMPGADFMNAASGGVATKLGTWSGTGVNGPGTAAHFRFKNNAGSTTHMQGAVSTSGSDLNLDNTSINTGQTVTISTFTLTDGNP